MSCSPCARPDPASTRNSRPAERLGGCWFSGLEIIEDFAPLPDILVIDMTAALPEANVYPRSAVLLAVEIVSPCTRRKDRMIRPMDRARAGVPYFWRIESEDFAPAVYTFRLDETTGQYFGVDVHRKLLRTTQPFDTEIELTGLGG
ncbi:Uma2 family endonuclease [Nocardia niigatensis]